MDRRQDSALARILDTIEIGELLGMVAGADLRVDGLVGIAGQSRRCLGLRKEQLVVEGRTLFEHATGLFQLAAESPAAPRFRLTVAAKDPQRAREAAARAGVSCRALREPGWVRSNGLQLLACLSELLGEHARSCARCGGAADPECEALGRHLLLLGCCDHYKKQPQYAASELRALLAAATLGRVVFVEQLPGSVPVPDLAELGVTLVEVTHEGASGARLGAIRSMKEKDPESSQYAPEKDLLVGVNTMIGAGPVPAWLALLGAARAETARLVLDAAAAEDPAACLYEAARCRGLAPLDFSRDLHAALPRDFEHYALYHDVPWDDKGVLKQLRTRTGGVYVCGEGVRVSGGRAVSAVIAPALSGGVDLHVVGAEEVSVVVKPAADGRIEVFVIGDSVTGREIKAYLAETDGADPSV